MVDFCNFTLSIPGRTCTPAPAPVRPQTKVILLPPTPETQLSKRRNLPWPLQRSRRHQLQDWWSPSMVQTMSYPQPDPYDQLNFCLFPIQPYSFSECFNLHLKTIEVLAPITIFGQTPLLRTPGHCQFALSHKLGLLRSLIEAAFLLLICFYPTICTSIKHPKLSVSIFGLLAYFSF